MFDPPSQTYAPKNFLMGGRAEGLACADLGARTPSALAEILLIVIEKGDVMVNREFRIQTKILQEHFQFSTGGKTSMYD